MLSRLKLSDLESREKGLLFGFGRMGITHIGLINKFHPNTLNWYIVDPSLAVRCLVTFFGRLIGVRMLSEKNIQNHKFSVGLVCSPPKFHRRNLDLLEAVCDKIFVEKPGFLGPLDSKKTYVGYSLRHHPCIAFLEKVKGISGVKKLSVVIRANTVLAEGSGWRSTSSQGGVLNEFGSHAVNLAKFLVKEPFELRQIKTEKVFSKACPDKCDIEAVTASNTAINIRLNWSDSTARKPVFFVSIVLDSGEIWETDIYQVWQLDSKGEKTSLSGVASWANGVEFYIRGLEFSEQARYFVSGSDFSNDLQNSLFTDQFLEECK